MRLPDQLPLPFHALRQRTIDVGGVRVSYAEAGEGPPVLVLHGAVFAGNVFMWGVTAALARAGMRAIAPDFPGWGDSAKPAEAPYSMGWYHAFLRDFLDALGIPRVAIVGHSMGALLGSSFAVLHPERVSAGVLVAAPPAWVDFELPMLFRPFTVPVVGELAIGALPVLGRDHPLGIRAYYEGLMHAPAAIDVAQMTHMLEGCLAATADRYHRRAFLRTMRANLAVIRTAERSEFAARLRERPLPVMLIAGREDRLFPLPLIAGGTTAHPAVRLEVLEGCGHFPMWERAPETEALVTAFLTADAGCRDRPARL